MFMKITLIQPQKILYGSDAEKHWSLARPFSLLFLAAAIKKHATHCVDIVDLESGPYRNVSLQTIFQDSNSDVYGITATTFTRFEAIKLAKYLKEHRPDSQIVVGGVHFMYCPEDTLSKVPEIDVVVRGEGEIPIVEYLDAIASGQSLHRVKGISFREGSRIIHNPDQAVFEDLDSLPTSLDFTWEQYPEYLFGYPDRIPATSVISSRGCPHKCIFCSKAGMKYRLRDPKKVGDEIEVLKKQLGVEAINFLDLTFTANPRHAQAVCREMIQRGLDVRWWCESRANIPLDLLDIMKAAGCVSLAVGVESGSPRVLSKISKGISTDMVRAFCQKCFHLGIHVEPYFMFSHPGETIEDVRRTLSLVYELEKRNADCSFQPTMIFPGTEIERISRQQGILPDKFSWSESYHSDLNVELGQLPNAPLFMDLLTPADLRRILEERNLWKGVAVVSRMTIKELVANGLEVLLNRKSKARRYLFSPRFYHHLLTGRVKQR
jgi:radical SAM superfamily enzyme YgiQ (UPF0313 family)